VHYAYRPDIVIESIAELSPADFASPEMAA